MGLVGVQKMEHLRFAMKFSNWSWLFCTLGWLFSLLVMMMMMMMMMMGVSPNKKWITIKHRVLPCSKIDTAINKIHENTYYFKKKTTWNIHVFMYRSFLREQRFSFSMSLPSGTVGELNQMTLRPFLDRLCQFWKICWMPPNMIWISSCTSCIPIITQRFILPLDSLAAWRNAS